MTSYNPLEQFDVEQVVVKTKDGRTWLAEYDSSRRLVPTKLLEEPPKSKTPEPSSSGSPTSSEPGKSKAQEIIEKLLGGASAGKTSVDPKTGKVTWKRSGGYNPLGGGEFNKSPEPGGAQPPEILPKLDDTVFRARLSSVMTDNKYDRVVRGRTRGKLDMTRLFKAQTRSTSLFTQKSERKNKMYNIVLCIDESGSMLHKEKDGKGGWKTRAQLAAEVAVFLSKNFVGLNINLAIVGFNHYFIVHKQFDQRITDYQKLQDDIVRASHNSGSGCNHDLDAMSLAYKMFGGREGQNILVYMSDGSPATCGVVYHDEKIVDKITDAKANKRHDEYYNPRNDSPIAYDPALPMAKGRSDRDGSGGFRHLIKANESLADIVGVGIQSECSQVPDAMKVYNLEELKPKMVMAIKKKVKRG